jgi:hypothetical protein
MRLIFWKRLLGDYKRLKYYRNYTKDLKNDRKTISTKKQSQKETIKDQKDYNFPSNFPTDPINPEKSKSIKRTSQ